MDISPQARTISIRRREGDSYGTVVVDFDNREQVSASLTDEELNGILTALQLCHDVWARGSAYVLTVLPPIYVQSYDRIDAGES